MVLNEIGRLFYGHSRKYGWTVKAMAHATALLSAWRIRMEESAGPFIHSRVFLTIVEWYYTPFVQFSSYSTGI